LPKKRSLLKRTSRTVKPSSRRTVVARRMPPAVARTEAASAWMAMLADSKK
jgi:hypothetical protein